jgi:ppGpp synthetase/RelA/SpoT-type nucleotidyltranferase
MNDTISDLIQLYKRERFEIEQFFDGVLSFFTKHPILTSGNTPIIHSIKSRLKDPDHLHDKINRKIQTGVTLTKDNFFDTITDLAGVRILHLHSRQFVEIHNAILKKISLGDWIFKEPPTAYSWDPDTSSFFKSLSIVPTIKPSHYTSVHYLVKPPREKSIACCEIQVRSLFEEIWGEIDHQINYPYRSDSEACKAQLVVLSRLAATGTKLVDSIYLSYQSKKD